MCVIAPRRGSRTLEIELLGDIARKRTVRYEVLRRIIEIGVIERKKFRPKRILLVHGDVDRLVAAKVGGRKILAADVMRAGGRELVGNQGGRKIVPCTRQKAVDLLVRPTDVVTVLI